MASATSTEVPIAPGKPTGAALWFPRVAVAAMVIAGIAIVANVAVMLWAQNEFTQPESIVATQSVMLARGQGIYSDWHHYPYTVNAYMPVFYLAQAALIRLGLPPLQAGRMISFAALLGIYTIVWRILMVYTDKRACAWTGVLLGASTSLLISWGTVGQVDMLAVFLSITGFYFYSRYAVLGEPTLVKAAAFVIAALFVKQTVIACPAAIFLVLLIRKPKVALQFGAGVAGAGLILVFTINAATHGTFLAHTVFANLNPFAWDKLQPHVKYMATLGGQLIILAIAGFHKALRTAAKEAFLYLGLALAVLAITAPKIGSDSNYQIETTTLLIVCSCLGLESLGFFELIFTRNKSWIPLLQIPLALHIVLNLRVAEPFLLTRVAKEQQFRGEIAALNPYLADGGRVLSTDIDAVLHYRGRIEVEPLIYKLLVRAGRIDPEPLRRDIAAGTFSTILLYQDVNGVFDTDLELPTLPDSQIQAIRQRYKLVQHIPGPYLQGIFVYKPDL